MLSSRVPVVGIFVMNEILTADMVVFRARAAVSLSDHGLLSQIADLLLAWDDLRPRHVLAGTGDRGERLVLSDATVDRVASAIADCGGGRFLGGERGEAFSLEIALWRRRLPWRDDEAKWQLPEGHFRGDSRQARSGRALEMATSLCLLMEPVWAYAHWAPDQVALASTLECDAHPWPPLLGAYWLNVFGSMWSDRVGRDRLAQLPGAWRLSELPWGGWLAALYGNPLECGTSTARHAARAAAAYVNTKGLRAEIEAADRAAWEAWAKRPRTQEERRLLSALEHNAEACLKIQRTHLGPGASADGPTLTAIERHLRAHPEAWRDDEDTFVLLHGSLLGEVLVRSLGGHWLAAMPIEESAVVFPDRLVEPFRIARERWTFGECAPLDAPLREHAEAES